VVRSWRFRPLARGAAAALALGVLLAACGDDANPARPTATATGRYGGVHTELCKAKGQADGGDLPAAKRTFDDVHAAIHELATATEEVDRAAAARLLEAKQRVEADLTAQSLADLVPPVAEAVTLTGGSAPASCS
jgi:hypothetical protein